MACKKPKDFLRDWYMMQRLYSAVQASKDSDGKPNPYKAMGRQPNGTHLGL